METTCPHCDCEFNSEDYEHNTCPDCKAEYYFDIIDVIDEDTGEICEQLPRIDWF